LQNVVRRWYHRGASTVRLFDELCENADSMEQALLRGDIASVGACLQRYLQQKKRMAGPTAEPPAIAALTAALAPHVHGLSLGGAGGGGFMLIITQRPAAEAQPLIQQSLNALRTQFATQHRAAAHRAAATNSVTGGTVHTLDSDTTPATLPSTEEIALDGDDDESNIGQACLYTAAVDDEGLRVVVEGSSVNVYATA